MNLRSRDSYGPKAVIEPYFLRGKLHDGDKTTQVRRLLATAQERQAYCGRRERLMLLLLATLDAKRRGGLKHQGPCRNENFE